MEQLETWISNTRDALYIWLQQACDRAEDGPSKTAIASRTKSTDEVWAKFESKTDVQTGTIYEESEQQEMLESMKEEATAHRKVHDKLVTYHRHVERMCAESSWEDFLYYQNVWNRKDFNPFNEFYMTKADRVIQEAQIKKQKKKAAAKENNEKPKNNEDRSKAEVAQFLKKLPPRPVLRVSEAETKRLYVHCRLWRNHMIQLYTKHKLAYRKRMPSTIEPDKAHRYSQPPRGTVNKALDSGKQRSTHLELRFPRRKRVVLDTSEVEEHYPKKSKLRENDKIGEEGWECISFELDDEACKRLQHEKEAKNRKDPLTQALRPVDHVLHHGSMDTSFNWPTSFDNPEEGGRIAMTTMRKRYIFENTPCAKDNNDDRTTDMTDGVCRKLRKIQKAPRYKRAVEKKTGIMFYYDSNADGTVVGRDSSGSWMGKWKEGNIEVEKGFETNNKRERIRLPDRYSFQNEFQVHNKGVEDLPNIDLQEFRANRPEEGGQGHELSADEADDYVETNKHFRLSGNNHPTEVESGLGNGENVRWSSAPVIDSNSHDSESDDEGDLFTLSYNECSGKTDHYTKTSMENFWNRLGRAFGKFPPLTLEKLVGLIEQGTSEEEIEDEYLIWMNLYKD